MALILTKVIIRYEYELFTLNYDIYGKVKTQVLCHMLLFVVVLVPNTSSSLSWPAAVERTLFSLAFFISLAKIIT